MTGRKRKLVKVLLGIFMLMLGFALGIGIAMIIDTSLEGRFSFTEILISLLLLFFAYAINVVLHEGGHLVMGLLTGYRFLSFRILSWILIKDENGRYHVDSFSIPGTLGQCLLIPPELDENGHMPNVLYNLGGIMVNFLITILSVLIFFLTPITGYARVFFGMLGLTSLLMGLENAIPLNALGMNNDGSNMVSLAKSPRVVKALWKQLKVNAYQTQGYLFQQMPKELFTMPTVQEMGDSIISAEAVFIENLEMEMMDHEKTLETIDYLLNTKEINLIDIYRVLLQSDRILLRLILQKPVNVDKDMRKALKQFSVFPNALVTRYAIARLLDKDSKEDEKIRKQFEKTIGKYPFRSDKLTLPRYMDEIDKRA